MTRTPKISRDPSSFRDPSGHIFYQDDQVYRQVNPSYLPHLNKLFESGLYDRLIEKKQLIKHTPQTIKKNKSSDGRTFRADKIQFVSYPYEWTFSQLKDAALLTLHIQKEALTHEMSLKDASAFNVQFRDDQPVFIDLLSFENYQPGKPWVAYKQFCQHFLAPLALMSLVDYRLGQLFRIYIDGIPLDLAGTLLPKKTYLNLGLAAHIHLHARNQQKFANKTKTPTKSAQGVSKTALLGIIDSLESTINGLHLPKSQTEWGDYYTFTNYTDTAFKKKKQLVAKFLKASKAKTVWDIGANSGEFSRIASQLGMMTISSDLDAMAVEKNYHFVKTHHEKNLLPLIIDLTNPSAGRGWANQERQSLIQRGPADTVMALALIHHLAISNNLPFEKIAEFMRQIGHSLIIEFVPKTDSQVKKLLATREDIFGEYDQESFEAAFGMFFGIVKRAPIPGTKRTLYFMKTK